MLNELQILLGLGGGRADKVDKGETQPLLVAKMNFLPSPKKLLATWLCLMVSITNGLLDGVMYGLAVFTEKLAQVLVITNQ